MLAVSMALMNGTVAIYASLVVIRGAGALHVALVKWGRHSFAEGRSQLCVAVNVHVNNLHTHLHLQCLSTCQKIDKGCPVSVTS